jgi:hypothetical protein
VIIRRKQNSSFTVLPNHIVSDERLSVEARWLMCYLLTKPNDWEVQVADIQKVGKVGRDRAYAIVRECIDVGYITRRKHADGSTTYEVYDTPPTADSSPLPENTDQAGQPIPEKPDLENPDQAFQDHNKYGIKPRTESDQNIKNRDFDLRKEFREVFWPAYPNQVDEVRAEEAWVAVRAEVTVAEIMAGLELYKLQHPPKQDWLSPTTFLKNKRFRDRPATRPGVTPNSAPGTPTKWILRSDPRWARLADRYVREKKCRVCPATSGRGGSGWRFPEAWVAELEKVA